MNLFERLVDQVLAGKTTHAPLRSAVEKELLHHDILREMSQAGLLAGLTLVGGTCLRLCYGSDRLSEDLDFTGGADFTSQKLKHLARTLEKGLQTKYGLKVTVTEPVKESDGVDTWKLCMVTRPERRDLPSQRIHVDVCAIPSYDRRPMMLQNYYQVDMGTAGLILQAESREEVLADKIVALAFRPNRLKNRDLWDMAWLLRQGVKLPLPLLPAKLKDHRRTRADFMARLRDRTARLRSEPALRRDFVKEMQRFIPPQAATATVEQAAFWDYLCRQIQELSEQARASV